MEYAGYVVIAVIAFLVGWIVRPPKAQPKIEEVTVSLKIVQNQMIKDLYPMELAANTGDNINWVIFNGTDNPVDVYLVDFADKPSKTAKMPLTGKLEALAIQPGSSKVIDAKVKPNAMLLEHPAAHPKDEFQRRYQDFTYKLKVGNQTIDPEIRIREC